MIKAICVISIALLGIESSAGANENAFIEIFENLRSAEPRERTYFYTREAVAYYLGTIVEETSDEAIINAVEISSNVMNIVDQVDSVERYEVLGDTEKPVLQVVYTDFNDVERELRFGFEKENNIWLISSIHELR